MQDNKTKAQKIVNTISKKQKCTIRIVQKCNSNGEIKVNLNPEFIPNELDASYSLSLIKFAAINNITNVNETNNKFNYKVGNTKKRLTIPKGFYDIKQYNDEVKRQIKLRSDNPDNIDISINEATGFVNIKLLENYSVFFNEDNTFRDSLGFNSEEIKGNDIHVANRMCNLLPTQSIFIHINIVRGNKIISQLNNNLCQNSNIIFDFPFNYRYGAPITFTLSPKLTESEIDLSSNKIRDISISFTDDNGKPVIFGDDPVSITLRIRQD